MFSKSHVGRPSNEELKQRRIKKALIYGGPALVILIMIVLISSGNLSNLMGNSVTTYYCEDSSYTLSGTKCTKLIKEKAHLLGDVDGNGKIKSNDVMMILRYTNSKTFSELEIAAMDVNEDEIVNEQDYQVLYNYISGKGLTENGGLYEIGKKLVCPKDYKLEGEYCTKTLEVAAKKKVEEVKDTFTITYNSNINSSEKQTMEQQIVKKGNKTKLHKNEFIYVGSRKQYFSGWTVRTKGGKYYCYKDEAKKETEIKDLSKGGTCDSVVLSDEQIIPDEILVDDLILTALWRKNITAEFLTVSAKTTNIRTGKVTVYENVSKQSDYDSNTEITVNISINKNDKENDYYYIIEKSQSGKTTESSCTKLTGNINLTENIKIIASQNSSSPTANISLRAYKDSNCTIAYEMGESDSSSYSNYVGGHRYYSKTFSIEYDYNGGENSNNHAPVSYGYNYENKQSLVFPGTESSVRKRGYELLYYIVKNSENKFLCYENSDKSSESFTSESTCKKYGYVEYKPNDKVFFATGKNKDKFIFIAQWSNDEKKESDITFNLNCPSDLSNCKNMSVSKMSHILQGSKAKLNNFTYGTSRIKVNSDKYYTFGGWAIQNIDNNKYYCYVDAVKTKKEYVDESTCKKYGYVYLKNNQEIPDEILGSNLSLKARWLTDNELIKIEPIKEEVTNVQNGKVSENSDVKNRTYFPSNSKVSFRIKVDKYSSMSKYRLIYSTNVTGGTKTSECKDIPASGEIVEKMLFTPTESGKSIESTAKKMSIAVALFSDKCSTKTLYFSDGSVRKDYELQSFNVKYDANGGKVFYDDSSYGKSSSTSNLKSYTAFYYYNSDKRSTRSSTAAAKTKRPGYDLIGYKVKNSSNKYICYKDSKKSTRGYTDESTCKKYGYVIYGPNDQLSRTTSVNGETLTFIAQWTNSPVTVTVGKLGTTSLSKGTQVHIPITFKVNDTENTYYYKWGYLKWGYTNLNKDYVKNASQFISKFDSFNNISYGQYGDAYVKTGGLGGPASWNLDRSDGCRKIVNNDKFVPTLTMNRYVNAGIIAIYSDNKCSNIVSSEKNVHKLTEVYFCKNCNY